jgi:hypothetical protein
MFRCDSAELARLTAASIPIRRRQKALSCGFCPAEIWVAQGPYGRFMAKFLFDVDYWSVAQMLAVRPGAIESLF